MKTASRELNRIATIGIIVVLAIAASVFADTEEPKVILGPLAKGLIAGPGMNAAGKILRGCEFVGQDLSGAIFDGADLRNARIHDCNLSEVSFRDASLTGAKVGECIITKADFTDAWINGIESSIGLESAFDFLLSEEQLKSTNSYKAKALSECTISAATGLAPGQIPTLDFRGARLDRATLKFGDFTASDFTGAHIRGTAFESCRITFDQLASTDDFKKKELSAHIYVALEGRCNLAGFRLQGSKLSFADSASVDLTNADIAGCALSGPITVGHVYTTRNYKTGNLSCIHLYRLNLAGCDLQGMNLTGAIFVQCNLTSARLTDAVITAVNFGGDYRECRGLTIDQIKSTWNYKHGHMEGIMLPKEIAEALRKK